MAEEILANWEEEIPNFVKVMPIDYKRVLMELAAEENKISAVAS